MSAWDSPPDGRTSLDGSLRNKRLAAYRPGFNMRRPIPTSARAILAPNASRSGARRRKNTLLGLVLCCAFPSCVVDDEAATADGGTAPVADASPPDPTQDLDFDGQSPADGDCNDDDPSVLTGGREICGDGIDQDCDGVDLSCADADADRDGFSINQGDCDDTDALLSPGRVETCDDGVDQDCDGRDLPCAELDMDGDGYSVALGDCDDTSARIRPGATDTCEDGVDQDCDGADAPCVDDADFDEVVDGLDNCRTLFNPDQADRDGDGVGDACDNCEAVQNVDQADADGNGRGDACDANTDGDGDGVTQTQGDCNDTDPLVFPGATERCDGNDDDCNGFIDDGCPTDLRTPLVNHPAGPSLLGSRDADAAACGRDPSSDENCDEVPQRQVQVPAFAVEAHEVTNAQYAVCLEAGRCPPLRRPQNGTGIDWFEDPAFANHPVVWVSQNQAATYCAWAGRRLLTEAEYERAARGDQPLAQRRYIWGDTPPVPCDTANVQGCLGTTSAVQAYAGDRTALGVFDLGGNAFEIVAGYHYGSLYRVTAEGAPAPGPVVNPPVPDMPYIPVRGGSYRSQVAFSTLTYRGFRELFRPGTAHPELGFRCAVTRP